LVPALCVTPVMAQRFGQARPHPASGHPLPEGEGQRAQGLLPLGEGGPERAKRVEGRDGGKDQEGPILRRAIAGYDRLLAVALAHGRLTLILIAALLVVSYGVYRLLGSEFLPEFDEGAFILDYVAPPGASLGETDR